MLDKMKALLKERGLCALATCRDNKPHCSLMSYITDEAGLTVHMITSKKTTKWANVTANPRVSLLIDTRTQGTGLAEGGFSALTVDGVVVREENEDERRRIIRRIVDLRPHLRGLAEDPETVPLIIRVTSFLLLDGVLDSHYEEV